MTRLLITLFGLWLGASAQAQAAEIIAAAGGVSKRCAADWLPVKAGEHVEQACNLRTDSHGMMQIRLPNGSIITVPRNSEISLPTQSATLKLISGGVNILPAQGYLTLDTMGYSLKTNGYLKLRQCGQGCQEVAGLYGKALSGEVIVEYPGGRSVLRGKTFRAPPEAKRPLLLARDTPLLAEDHQIERAVQAKAALAAHLQTAMEAFKSGQYEAARTQFEAVLAQSPTEPLVSYYLGLVALELKDKNAALVQLRKFTESDPDAARERGVGQLLTLLLTDQLQTEVKQALQQESQLSSQPPEPNTIAVQPFTNRSDPVYAALAKGIAAMLITDLSKVPGLKVLERQKVQKLVDEIRLSESGLVDEQAMVKAGRLMRAEKIMIGSFGVQ